MILERSGDDATRDSVRAIAFRKNNDSNRNYPTIARAGGHA
jgi:hypothetical protein